MGKRKRNYEALINVIISLNDLARINLSTSIIASSCLYKSIKNINTAD